MLAGATVTLLNMGVRHLGGLQSWELGSFDSLVRLQPDLGPDRRLLVVAISEADIQALGRFPISDKAIAQTLDKTAKVSAKSHRFGLVPEFASTTGTPRIADSTESTECGGDQQIERFR